MASTHACWNGFLGFVSILVGFVTVPPYATYCLLGSLLSPTILSLTYSKLCPCIDVFSVGGEGAVFPNSYNCLLTIFSGFRTVSLLSRLCLHMTFFGLECRIC